MQKNRKKATLILITLVLALTLALTATACTFTFDAGNGAPKTTGYVVMTEAAEPSTPAPLEDVIALLQPKVVEIYTAISDGTSAGSGVIIGKVNDEGGVQTGSIVVTNHHVVADGSKITVKLFTGESYTARLIGSDAVGDIAVLEIAATGIDPAVWLSDSDTLRVGATAIAIGNALGSLGGTVTKGVVSAKSRDISVEGNVMNLLQTDASINGGNSGGGLFSASGLLIGIVDAKVKEVGVEGLGFAIPSNAARALVGELMETATESGGYGYIRGRYNIGVTLSYLSTELWGGTIYVGISEIDTDGSAYLAGLRLRDEVVSVTVGTQTYTVATEVAAALSSKDLKLGDVVTLSVRTGGAGTAKTIDIPIVQYVYRMPV